MTSLEFQSVFARGIRERLDVAVVLVAAAVEHHPLDAFVLRLFGNQRAYRFGRRLIRAALHACLFLPSRRRGDRFAGRIVDELHVNVLEALLHREARPLGGSADFAADSLANSPSCFDSLFRSVHVRSSLSVLRSSTLEQRATKNEQLLAGRFTSFPSDNLVRIFDSLSL